MCLLCLGEATVRGVYRFDFPEVLDLSDFLDESAMIWGEGFDSPVYSLHSVLVHQEYRPNSGHYIAYIKADAGDGRGMKVPLKFCQHFFFSIT